jgi:hypothetical protein
MCRHVHVELSEAERKAMRRIADVLAPVYAAAILLVLGLSLLSFPQPRAPESFAAVPQTPVADLESIR